MKKVTSIPSVSRVLDRHLEQMASIPSVSRVLDRHLEQMASIPSGSREINRHLEQIAFGTSTLDRLSKLETLSAPVRAMAEANKLILTMNREDMLVNSVGRSFRESLQQPPEIIKGLSTTLDTSALLSASLAAQSKLFELQRFPLGAAINAAASLQDSLRINLDKFTISYKNLVGFTNHHPSIIGVLEPDIVQYPSYEVFREAELLEQITVPEDEQEVLDEYEVIAIPEERTLEDWLGEINSGFPSLLRGARAALHTNNPDRARHVTVSLRELIGRILHQFAPKDKIKTWSTDPNHYDEEGKPTRRARLLYICREINVDPLSKFVDANVTLALTLIKALSSEAHVIPCRLTDQQLQALMNRAESCLLFLLHLNSSNE